MTFQLVSGFSPNGRLPVCSFCGSGPGKDHDTNPLAADRPVVTTDLNIEMEGFVEFCVDCAADIGHTVDMISTATAEAAAARIKELEEEIALERDARHIAEKAYDALVEWKGIDA